MTPSPATVFFVVAVVVKVFLAFLRIDACVFHLLESFVSINFVVVSTPAVMVIARLVVESRRLPVVRTIRIDGSKRSFTTTIRAHRAIAWMIVATMNVVGVPTMSSSVRIIGVVAFAAAAATIELLLLMVVVMTTTTMKIRIVTTKVASGFRIVLGTQVTLGFVVCL